MESIPLTIEVHKSTVSRELKRNSIANGKYLLNKVHDMAGIRKERIPSNRRLDDALKLHITELIKTENDLQDK